MQLFSPGITYKAVSRIILVMLSPEEPLAHSRMHEGVALSAPGCKG